MKLTEAELFALLRDEESESLEFKAKLLSDKEIGEYAVALGNAGGGWLLLGITDRKPRSVVGIAEQGQSELQRIRRSVYDFTGIRIQACPVTTSSGYVLGISIPPRPPGKLFHTKSGKFLTRLGQDVRGMTAAEVETILREAPPTKPDLKVLVLFEVRRLRYEVEQRISLDPNWVELNEILAKLVPYGRDFDYDVKDEVIYAASLAADPHEMQADTARQICHLVSESLPITNLISCSQRKISTRDEKLLCSALGVVHSLTWDGCRYGRNREVILAASHLLTVVLRYAVLNEIALVEQEAIEIVERCVALCGEKDELVKILIFARDDALTYRCK